MLSVLPMNMPAFVDNEFVIQTERIINVDGNYMRQFWVISGSCFSNILPEAYVLVFVL